MRSVSFLKLIRKHVLNGFVGFVALILLGVLTLDIDENTIKKFSALLTPVVAVFGGLLAVASFQMNYDKRVSELRRPIDDLIEEFAQHSRELQIAGPPGYEELRDFARRVSIYLDPELGDRVLEFFSHNDMAGQGLSELGAEFASIARKKLETFE